MFLSKQLNIAQHYEQNPILNKKSQWWVFDDSSTPLISS